MGLEDGAGSLQGRRNSIAINRTLRCNRRTAHAATRATQVLLRFTAPGRNRHCQTVEHEELAPGRDNEHAADWVEDQDVAPGRMGAGGINSRSQVISSTNRGTRARHARECKALRTSTCQATNLNRCAKIEICHFVHCVHSTAILQIDRSVLFCSRIVACAKQRRSLFDSESRRVILCFLHM